MDLKDLMSISGQPGLFRFISQGRNSIIVESLEDKKRMSVYSTSRISTFEEIAVFTESGEIPLAELLKKMYRFSDGKEAISHKSSAEEIKKYFVAVLPDYDRERVYLSDMKKIINWYNLLVRYDLLHPEEDEVSEDDKDADNQGISTTDETPPGETRAE